MAPLSVTISNKLRKLLAGEDYKFSCLAQGHSPAVEFSWFLGDVNLPASSFHQVWTLDRQFYRIWRISAEIFLTWPQILLVGNINYGMKNYSLAEFFLLRHLSLTRQVHHLMITSWLLQRDDVSLVQYRPTKEDHGRTLRCQAFNPLMPLQSIQDSLVLDIYCEYRGQISSQGNICHSSTAPLSLNCGN